MSHAIPEMLPAQFDYLRDLEWETVSEGESDATVYRLTGESVRYLKVSSHTAQYTVRDDYQRLLWLQGKIAVPQILDYLETETQHYLLMDECAGLHPMHDDLAWDAGTRINVLVNAATMFHALDIRDCPFRRSFDDQIAIARDNIDKGRVNIEDWDEENQGRTIDSLFEEFVSLKPDTEDWVVTHGDLYPVNIRVDEDSKTVTGFIDVGAVAIADRYTDFAPLQNAIGWHLDPVWLERFFESYGVPLDRQKLRFYQLFEEFC